MRFNDLMKLTLGELHTMFNRNTEKVKRDHDVAVLLGSAGVSPEYYTRYLEAMKIIDKE